MAKPRPGQAVKSIKAVRLARISQLLLRGLSQREIQTQLVQLNVVNPATGKGYSLGTINKDVQELERMWLEEAMQSVDARRARLTAELREVRRKAWADGDMRTVLSSIQQERALFGVDAPSRLQYEGRVEQTHEFGPDLSFIFDMDAEELDAFIRNVDVVTSRLALSEIAGAEVIDGQFFVEGEPVGLDAEGEEES